MDQHKAERAILAEKVEELSKHDLITHACDRIGAKMDCSGNYIYKIAIMGDDITPKMAKKIRKLKPRRIRHRATIECETKMQRDSIMALPNDERLRRCIGVERWEDNPIGKGYKSNEQI